MAIIEAHNNEDIHEFAKRCMNILENKDEKIIKGLFGNIELKIHVNSTCESIFWQYKHKYELRKRLK